MNNLRLLEYALALDRHRSFRQAADAMRVTQPTFSRGIAALEATLGARLFDRSNRRVEPTPEGTVLLHRARRLLADAAAIQGALSDYQNLRSGRIAIGVGPFPLDLSVIECVVRLCTRYPLLQVEVFEGHWRDFSAKLLQGEVEVAVMEMANVAADNRLQVEALPSHQGCFFCRAGHPLLEHSGVTFVDMLDYPFVGVRMPIRVVVPGSLDTRLLSLDPVTGDVIPRIATTSFAAARAIIKRSDGIGIAAPAQLAEDVRRGELAILDADASTIRSGYGIAYLRDRTLSPGAQAFVTTLKEVEAQITEAEAGANATAQAGGRSARRRQA
jgi:DNA-binding transcriptional LysR family regulator